jgi:DNA-directed RNA polymerase subunit H
LHRNKLNNKDLLLLYIKNIHHIHHIPQQICRMASSTTTHISSGTISTLYKSRNILLQLLENQGMDVSNYTDYGVAEIQTMYASNQLDMLLSTEKDVRPTRKVYVKYYLAKTLRRENINHMIDDLYYLEQVLQPTDTLIIVMKQEVNETIVNILNEIWEKDQIFIVIHSLDRLQFNILEHQYVPEHVVLSESEQDAVVRKYNITDMKQLPSISRYDPVALAIGLRPGQICKITRPSKTSVTSLYYRYCIAK